MCTFFVFHYRSFDACRRLHVCFWQSMILHRGRSSKLRYRVYIYTLIIYINIHTNRASSAASWMCVPIRFPRLHDETCMYNLQLFVSARHVRLCYYTAAVSSIPFEFNWINVPPRARYIIQHVNNNKTLRRALPAKSTSRKQTFDLCAALTARAER